MSDNSVHEKTLIEIYEQIGELLEDAQRLAGEKEDQAPAMAMDHLRNLQQCRNSFRKLIDRTFADARKDEKITEGDWRDISVAGLDLSVAAGWVLVFFGLEEKGGD